MAVRHVITRGFGTMFDVGESQIKYVITAGFDSGIPPELSEAVYSATVAAQDYSRAIPADPRSRKILK